MLPLLYINICWVACRGDINKKAGEDLTGITRSMEYLPDFILQFSTAELSCTYHSTAPVQPYTVGYRSIAGAENLGTR
jgi:hypothetical protein